LWHERRYSPVLQAEDGGGRNEFRPYNDGATHDDEVVGGGGSKDGMGYKKRKGFNLEVKPFSNL
jgi:hypothetical protein